MTIELKLLMKDTSGVGEYARFLSRLCSKSPWTTDWWDEISSEVRSQMNKSRLSDPFAFDLKQCQSDLKVALSHALPKRGLEHGSLIHHRKEHGFSTTASGPGGDMCPVVRKINDPLKYCAQCKVTAGLKLCSGCHSIAFCSRDCQLKFWPQHKSKCKEVSKHKKKQKNKGNKCR